MKFSKHYIALLVFLSACSSKALIPTPTSVVIASIVPTVPATITPNSTVTAMVTDTAIATSEVKHFSTCKIEKFRDCLMSEDDLFNNYLLWLQKQPSSFASVDLRKITMPVFNEQSLMGWGVVVWPDKATRSQVHPRLDLAAEVQVKGTDSVLYPYIVIPIEILNQSDPNHSHWIVTVDSYYLSGYGYGIQEIETAITNENIPLWRTMKVVPMLGETTSPGHKEEDPLAKRTLANYPNLPDLIKQFMAGDHSALSKPGLVLLTSPDPGTLFR